FGDLPSTRSTASRLATPTRRVVDVGQRWKSRSVPRPLRPKSKTSSDQARQLVSSVVHCPDMKRRDFLVRGGAFGLPLQAQAMAQAGPRYTGRPQLKITDIQATLVGVGGRNLCFVK